jgi:hypothetical protein
MAEVLQITNNGPLIVQSNFWQSEYARAGKFNLSVNAGAFQCWYPNPNIKP